MGRSLDGTWTPKKGPTKCPRHLRQPKEMRALLENVEDLLSGEILVGIKMTIYSPHSYSEASPAW